MQYETGILYLYAVNITKSPAYIQISCLDLNEYNTVKEIEDAFNGALEIK